MNQFEEKCHELKVAYKADKAAVWEAYRAKDAELKKQIALVANIKGVPTLMCIIATIKEQRRMLKADRDRKLSKFGRTYHFMRKETLAEMSEFYSESCAVSAI